MEHQQYWGYPAAIDQMLSLTGKRWVVKRLGAAGSGAALVQLLARERGLQDMLSGERQTLSDPMLFPEMGRAVERIHTAVEHRESIGIFGDYDADGITGVAQLVRYFRRHRTEPIVRLPHRQRDGYGLKSAIVQELHAKGVKLLLTVDTGIAAHEEIALATELGIDVIVTDHHQPTLACGRASRGRPSRLNVL